MPESFFGLSAEDRLDALRVAASKSGKPTYLLEKDIWVVWSLRVLFGAPFAGDLVFTGGTSLSKGYEAIERFSEDVDVTYDIRAIARDLVSGVDDGLPPSRSQADRWARRIRNRLEHWVRREVSPVVKGRLEAEGMTARVSAQKNKVEIVYEPLTEEARYVRPVVLLEFGARSTGEPSEKRSVTCDAAAHLPDVAFPAVVPKVMRPERTFWEKATAIHVFCKGGSYLRAERFSRHWYDVASLDKAGFVQTAIADRDLARHVARHKGFFFRERDEDGVVIDYQKAVSGGLQLTPDGPMTELLAADYAAMVSGGLVFEDEAPDFASLVAGCRAIQDRANDAV